MARKQQSRSTPKTLEVVRARRLALEEQIRSLQGAVFALQKEFQEAQDQKSVQQHRRKLRYPSE